jgi:hypothetical protein
MYSLAEYNRMLLRRDAGLRIEWCCWLYHVSTNTETRL